MHSNFQVTAYPFDRGGADSSVITRALRGLLGAQPYLFMGRIMAARIKTFIANRWSLQYRTLTEIHFFCELSLAFETNHSPLYGSMNAKWRLQ